MDKYKFFYSPIASADLKGIYTYIAFELKEKAIAQNQVNRIRNAIKGLEELPNRFPKVEFSLNSKSNIRKIVVDNFLVFYDVDEINKEITVVRILYGGMNVENIINT